MLADGRPAGHAADRHRTGLRSAVRQPVPALRIPQRARQPRRLQRGHLQPADGAAGAQIQPAAVEHLGHRPRPGHQRGRHGHRAVLQQLPRLADELLHPVHARHHIHRLPQRPQVQVGRRAARAQRGGAEERHALRLADVDHADAARGGHARHPVGADAGGRERLGGRHADLQPDGRPLHRPPRHRGPDHRQGRHPPAAVLHRHQPQQRRAALHAQHRPQPDEGRRRIRHDIQPVVRPALQAVRHQLRADNRLLLRADDSAGARVHRLRQPPQQPAARLALREHQGGHPRARQRRRGAAVQRRPERHARRSAQGAAVRLHLQVASRPAAEHRAGADPDAHLHRNPLPLRRLDLHGQHHHAAVQLQLHRLCGGRGLGHDQARRDRPRPERHPLHPDTGAQLGAHLGVDNVAQDPAVQPHLRPHLQWAPVADLCRPAAAVPRRRRARQDEMEHRVHPQQRLPRPHLPRPHHRLAGARRLSRKDHHQARRRARRGDAARRHRKQHHEAADGDSQPQDAAGHQVLEPDALRV